VAKKTESFGELARNIITVGGVGAAIVSTGVVSVTTAPAMACFLIAAYLGAETIDQYWDK
jgi:hypothetical protein